MSSCKYCGGLIIWTKVYGKWVGRNDDGTDHWDRCSATRTKKVLESGEKFSDENGSGVIFEGRKHYMERVGIFTPASDFSFPSCDCKTPPWEDCEHTMAESLDLDQYAFLKSI